MFVIPLLRYTYRGAVNVRNFDANNGTIFHGKFFIYLEKLGAWFLFICLSSRFDRDSRVCSKRDVDFTNAPVLSRLTITQIRWIAWLVERSVHTA